MKCFHWQSCTNTVLLNVLSAVSTASIIILWTKCDRRSCNSSVNEFHARKWLFMKKNGDNWVQRWKCKMVQASEISFLGLYLYVHDSWKIKLPNNNNGINKRVQWTLFEQNSSKTCKLFSFWMQIMIQNSDPCQQFIFYIINNNSVHEMLSIFRFHVCLFLHWATIVTNHLISVRNCWTLIVDWDIFVEKIIIHLYLKCGNVIISFCMLTPSIVRINIREL